MERTNRINELHQELVPLSGKAESLAGELVRATCRIGYRFMNDGDQIGIGYGKETCNAAARFLLEMLPREIGDIVADMWALYSEDKYEEKLYDLCHAVAEYVDSNPDLRQTETKDMWDYFDKYEDVDDEEDEDDYYEEEEYEDEDEYED